jgi:hypothetical protein
MNAVAANVNAMIPNRSISEVWLPLLLMIFGGFCAAKIWDVRKDKKASKMWYVLWFILMIVGIGGGAYMYIKNKSPANIARASAAAAQAAREKATAGMQGFQNWRAARAQGAPPPPGAMGPLGNAPTAGAPPMMATR